jgi:hypothetical protein
MRRTRASIAVGIVVSVVAVLPATAGAAVIDQRSDQAALTAYRSYLQGAIARIPAARKAESAYVSTISQRCSGQLAALSDLSAGSVNRTALFDFGLELGGDVAITADAPARGPLATMAGTLTSLPWSSSRTARTVKRYLSAEDRLFGLAPSNLCADAQALVDSRAQSIPSGTAEWVAEFRGAASAQEAAARGFGRVLRKFETQADTALVASDNALNRQLFAALSGVVTSSAAKLISDLGLT